jgi:hypothetical protein
MSESAQDIISRVGPRGVEALRRTRGWARLAGVMTIAMAAITVISFLVHLGLSFDRATRLPLNVNTSLGYGLGILVAVWTVVVGGLGGWFALAYARGLETDLRRANGGGLEDALWWQRRYWTLQGVLTIIFIVLFVLGIAASVVYGLVFAMHHPGAI